MWGERRRALWGTALVVVLAGTTVACGDSAGGRSSTDRVIGVYLAVLRWAAETAEAPPPTTLAPGGPDATGDGEDDDLPVVYTLARGGAGVPAAVQVEVVKDLRDDLTVRFADARAEAIDDDEETEPVHDEGVLVSLGPVPDDGDEVVVTAEVYRSLDDDHAYDLELALSGERWVVVAATPR